MKQMTIEDMKRIELEVMDEIHRICRDHGLRYYLFYGSLLGAVRHGGFIPWDDDIDIVMMREDYEVLIGHFDEWRSSDRFSLALYKDGKNPCQYAKVVDSTTRVREAFARRDYGTGIWVDVFPLDFYDSANTACRKKIDRAGFMRSLILTNPDRGTTEAIRLAKKLACPLVANKDPMKYCKRMDECCKKLCPQGSDLLVCAITCDWGVLFPVELFAPDPVPVAFEDREYLTVAEKERALEIMYGDWQTPPPPGNREMHTMGAYYL